MDFVSFAYSLTLFLIPIIAYLLLSNKRQRSGYSQSTWTYYFKYWLAKKNVKAYLRKCKENQKYELFIGESECPKGENEMEEDEFAIYGNDQHGNSLYIKFTYKTGKINNKLGQIIMYLRLKNGDLYQLPNDTLDSFDYVKTFSLQNREWKARGLSISVLEPLKRYRILYNGFAKRTTLLDVIQFEHLKFNFVWHCANEPLFHPSDFDASLMAATLSRERWRDENWMAQVKDRPAYEQFGSLHGVVKGTGISPEVHLNLASYRKICWTNKVEDLFCYRDVNIFVAVEDGTLINVGARGLYNEGCSMLQYGSVFYPDFKVLTIKESDLNLEQLGDNEIIPRTFTLHIKTDKSSIKCVFHVNTEMQTRTKCVETAGFQIYTATAECNVNSKEGRATMTFWYYRKNMCGDRMEGPQPLLTNKEDTGIEKFVVGLDSEECKVFSITGGKGNSLGLLTSIQNKKFTVPEGFVVTVPAFREHIANNDKLKKAIDAIERTNTQNITELTNLCTTTAKLFASEPFDAQMSKEILDELQRTIAKISVTQTIRWAVRSSGVGEDSEELSAAGQNSTYLGCKSELDILNAITACWGSLFSFQSVQYRKQHGIKVNCDMGVVVQRMVDAECAGVLFTCHPLDGNPAEMVITSNYGLGESVVSGQSDPDTITLSRTYDGKISVKDATIGQKKEQILMAADDAGTKTEDVDANLVGKLSLNEERSILLGEVGVDLEREFGSPRDIEWAFYEDKLYLLQSRPVTTLANWSDEELLHEFDAPVFCEDDIYTRANTGEVFPGASTAFTCSIINTVLNQGIVESFDGYYSSFNNKAVPLFSNRFFLNVYNLMLRMPPDTIDIVMKASDLALYGHKITTPEMLETAKERFGVTKGLTRAKMFASFLTTAWFTDASVKKAQELGKYDVGLRDGMSLNTMRDAINDYCEVTKDIGILHSQVTQTSSFYQMILLLTLTENESDFQDDHYSDIALLLSSCTDVVSAEIPTRFQQIAAVIQRSDKCEEFVGLDANHGINWLKQNIPEASKMLDEFMKMHGHRSFREFELMEKSWAMQPEIVIKMIQSNSKVESVTIKQEPLSADATISKLKTLKGKLTRIALKFFIGKSRRAVSSREKTKSELIRSVNKMRIAYKKLAENLVAEGYLPNEELIFHLTNHELGVVIKNRDPVLVSKAMLRQRLYPVWDKLMFPEMNKGYPIANTKPANLITDTGDNITLKGTPVSPGEVIARACQIISLDDIGQLISGDILITHSTDIGWSPYFPMLAGVVTELGGLISHGGVVAREYGLPCLVGVQQATEYFKTGDMVMLSAKDGALKLIKRG